MAGLIANLVWAYLKPGTDTVEDDPARVLPLWQAVLCVAVGLAAPMVGARFPVDGAVSIARGYGL